MRVPKPPDKVLFFTSALFSKEAYYDKALQALERLFGVAAMESPPVGWDASDYYKKEMGSPLYRRFVFFRRPADPGELAAIKLKTYEIEKALSTEGKRNINIDPGYMTPAKIVLASTKDYAHRIYLSDGIYAEVTLTFRHGRFVPHVNTYRDYQDEKNLKIFMMARLLPSMFPGGW